ncbi:DUF4825 domain-containing protein [Sporosarcina sp. HYO08]|uniref:DUF4825 domain-containing protein n=1 Tax=Sporosarcina sp. HYO08 TaxID=1759557 RepID=UPI000795CE20|nr:DUF4825 domain-containing protein [Sporosarcina sp. HYO08]KXH87137.1 hypothetical protein AU377_00745 [Sporosarcina sp. HYO08]
MDRRRLLLLGIVAIAIPLFIWLQFFEIPNKVEIGEERMQQDPEQHEFEKVLSFENDYMGNASNISNLFGALPLHQYKGTLALNPEHLSLTMNYEVSTDELQGKAEQAVIYNTTAAFVLIHNLEEIEMHFQDHSYIVTRENVAQWFGNDFQALLDPEVFKKEVQTPLVEGETEKMLAAFMKGE